MPFHSKYEHVKWEKCALRNWLNNDFYNLAFSDHEQKAIINTPTELGCNDKVYILSATEASNDKFGFPYDVGNIESKTRRAKYSPYALSKGISESASPSLKKECNGYGDWHLRSNGHNNYYSITVLSSGSFWSQKVFENSWIYTINYGVRPCLHIDLNSSCWRYAGSISSAGTSSEEESSNSHDNNPNVSNDDNENTETEKINVKSIKISSNPSTTICAGKKVSLSAIVSPKNATQAVTWKSSNKNYATVTSKGVVTTKKAGIGKTVTITAKAKDRGGKTAKIRIKIVKDGVTEIKLKGKTSRPAGKQLTVKATVTAGKTANTELKWISSNKEYATVNQKGIVTLKEAGKGKYVRITAMATDGTGVRGSIKIKIT